MIALCLRSLPPMTEVKLRRARCPTSLGSCYSIWPSRFAKRKAGLDAQPSYVPNAAGPSESVTKAGKPAFAAAPLKGRYAQEADGAPLRCIPGKLPFGQSATIGLCEPRLALAWPKENRIQKERILKLISINVDVLEER